MLELHTLSADNFILENEVLCSKKGFLLNVEGKEKKLNPESFFTDYMRV